MGRDLERILVVDVESTCWDGKAPEGQVSEIIEIGACVLDVRTSERARIDPQPLYVQPSRSGLSPFCIELTGVQPHHLESAMTFREACELLDRVCGSRTMMWASYGDYDRQMFVTQCERDGVRYPFGPAHINVKLLFALLRGLRKPVGMARALDMADLALEGRHHSGSDDAWNIAGLLWHMLDVYPQRVNPWF